MLELESALENIYLNFLIFTKVGSGQVTCRDYMTNSRDRSRTQDVLSSLLFLNFFLFLKFGRAGS